MSDKHENEIVENEDLELDNEEFVEELENDDDLEELDETAASETLKPHGAPGEYRAQTLATFTQLLSQLKGSDLTYLFNQVQDLYGPNKAPGAEDKSSSNEATIKAKPSAAKGAAPIGPMPMQKLSVKEDVEEMLGSDETLSEEFKERAETIFEAALNTRVNLEMARLAEEYSTLEEELQAEFEAKLEENTSTILENMVEKIDQYMNFCVEEWMEENKIAIENSLRMEIAENFISGLQNLFAEHYIDVPEERFDIVADLKRENTELQEQLNAVLDEKIALETDLNEAIKETVLDEASEGLTVTQSERLRTLSEGIDFVDADTFKHKVDIIKESYFTEKKKASDTGLLTETIDGTVTTDAKAGMHPGMDKYVKALSGSKN